MSCDQVIRENPASRGTETSAEVLVDVLFINAAWCYFTGVTSSEPLLDLDQLAEYHSYDPEEWSSNRTLSRLSRVCVCVCACVWRGKSFYVH